MPRERWTGTEWVTVDCGRAATERRGPAVHTDTMEPTAHQCDGRIYDSKSAFRRTTKEFGCEELGNDKPKAEKRPDYGTKEALLRAWDMAEAAKRR